MFTNKPWIIDLADPWTTASYTYFPNNKLKRINEIIEKIIFNYADKIVTVTENIADDYYKKYHHLKKNKFFIIPNGFDLDDYKELKITLNNKFTICYTGRIDLAGRDPGNFLKALLLFFKEFPLAKNDLQVLFVGGGGDYWQQNLKDNHLEDIVQFTGNVSHEKSIEFQMSSHLLLLIGGGSKYEQTGKIFEYLVAWKPILGLIREDSPAAEIIKATNTGIIISNEDCDKIKNAISHFYFKFKNGENLWKNRNQAEIDKYNWDNHARKLANIFNELSV